jgi:hypothetical protein
MCLSFQRYCGNINLKIQEKKNEKVAVVCIRGNGNGLYVAVKRLQLVPGLVSVIFKRCLFQQGRSEVQMSEKL